jgi:hypothetical protein
MNILSVLGPLFCGSLGSVASKEIEDVKKRRQDEQNRINEYEMHLRNANANKEFTEFLRRCIG